MNSKKVNVYPVMPIFTVYPPITQKQEGVELPLGKIEKCLIARARVEEIFPNGQTVRLNLRNYDKELSPIYHKEETIKEEEPKVDEPVKVEVKEDIVEDVKSEEEPQSVKVEVKEDIVEDVKSEEEPQSDKVKQQNKQQKNNYKKK